MVVPAKTGRIWRLPTRAMASAGSLVAARGMAQLGMFTATVSVARGLGRSGLGTYAVVTSIGALVVGSFGSGVPALALREIAAGRGGGAFLRRLAQVEVVMTAVATLGCAVLCAVFVGGWAGFGYGLLVGLAYILTSMVLLGSAARAGRGQYRRAAMGEGLMGVVQAVATVGALAAGWGLEGALAAIALGALAGALSLWCGLRLGAGSATPPPGRRMLRQSLPFVGLGLANGGYLRMDAIVVGAVATSEILGVYSAGYRALGPFSLVASGFGTVFYARLSRSSPEGGEWHRVRRQGRLMLVALIAPAVAVAFVAMPRVVAWIYGPEFSAATGPARILLLSVLALAWYWPDAHALNAAGRERTWVLILASGVVLDVALVVAFVPHLGAAGAAWAWVATECFLLVGVSLAARSFSAAGEISGAP